MSARPLTLTLAATLFPAALAQVLYSPVRSVSEQGIALRGWGSGTIRETDENALEGDKSIRISSRNIFQGGILDFASPIDLSAAFSDRASLLQFALLLPAGEAAGRPSEGGGRGGAAGVGAAGLGAGRGEESRSPARTDFAPLENVRVVLTTSDGKKSEAFLNIAARAAEPGWVRASVPLAAIRGFAATDKRVVSMSFSGDSVATFYLGEARVTTDATPLYAEPNVRELNLGLGEEYTFSAFGSGGSSELVFLWDFDASDGVQSDVEGQVVTRRFRRPGRFTVTLTVRDAFGLKEPYSTTLVVEVNP